MTRCANGTRKNAKTGKCEPKTTSSVNKTTTKGTQKNRLPKIYLSEGDINTIMEDNEDFYLEHNTDNSPDIVRTHLRKTYYKPQFKSNGYFNGKDLKLIKKTLEDAMPPQIKEYIKQSEDRTRLKNSYINLQLLKMQIDVLFLLYAKGKIKIEDFSSSRNKF